MNVVELENLTKDYGDGKGIFGLNLTVSEGETVGYVGTNGSGKTTTIRSILGFIRPTSGRVSVKGLSSWENSDVIAGTVGYVPGEIAFPDLKTGIEFLRCQAEFTGLTDMRYANSLIERLQLDPRAGLKRMSKGMKQKTALVAALMNDRPILIFDEPTTGLDPLMRQTFLDVLREERARGKTIFMSSHGFEELETTCDRVALINDGKIVDVADVNKIRNPSEKEFKIEFRDKADYLSFRAEGFRVVRLQEQYAQVTVRLPVGKTGELLGALSRYDVKFISEVPCTLEKYFKKVLFSQKAAQKEAQANVQ